MKVSLLLLTGFACALSLLACKKDEATTTTTTGANEPAGGGVRMSVSTMSATARITGARCDREVACNQVGAQKRFETREICAREEGKKTKDELKSTDCPNGLDEHKLKTCLDALAKQDCSRLVASLEAVDECKTGALCMSRP